jgi:hypothetical protein
MSNRNEVAERREGPLGTPSVLLADVFALYIKTKNFVPGASRCRSRNTWEQPQLFSEEVRAGFRSLRSNVAKSDVIFPKAG